MYSNRNTPLPDGQGHWWSGQTNLPCASVEPPTTTDTIPLETVPLGINENKNQQQKRRRRGNRRLQRFRQRLSKRGYDTETIAMLMDKPSGELGIIDPPLGDVTSINETTTAVSQMNDTCSMFITAIFRQSKRNSRETRGKDNKLLTTRIIF